MTAPTTSLRRRNPGGSLLTRIDGWLPPVPRVHSLMWMPPPASAMAARVVASPVGSFDGAGRCEDCAS